MTTVTWQKIKNSTRSPSFPASWLQQAPAVERANLIVSDPLPEAVLVEDVSALRDASVSAALGEVSQADGAPLILHIGLIVSLLQHSLEAVDWLSRPACESLRDQDKHATNGNSHNGMHVEEIVHIRIEIFHLSFCLRVDDQFIRIFGFELDMSHIVSNEDGEEHGEEEEEAEHHSLEEVVKSPQDQETDYDVDMEAEEKFEAEVSLIRKLWTWVLKKLEDHIGAGNEDQESQKHENSLSLHYQQQYKTIEMASNYAIKRLIYLQPSYPITIGIKQ